MKSFWSMMLAGLVGPQVVLAAVLESGVDTGVVVVEPPATSEQVFKNDKDQAMKVALTVEPTGSATCNVRANQDEQPISVIAGAEASALAIVRPGNAVAVQAAGANGTCRWKITSVVPASSP